MKNEGKLRKKTQGLSHQKGFTLIELLISFALIAFLIAGIAQLTVHSLFVQRRAECALRAAELASSKLEYLKSLPYDSDELKPAIINERLKERGSRKTFWREWRIEDVSSRLKRVEIECFAEICPQKRTRVILYLCRELGF